MSLFEKITLGILVFLGILGQGSLMFRSGWESGQGISFWGTNAHDGLWHLSIINTSFRDFPFTNPIFSGKPLENYHFFADFVTFIISITTHISVLDLYFRIIPIFISGSFGILVFVLTKKITQNNMAGLWAVFISYFAGSFGFVPILWGLKGINNWESIFWSNQSVSLLLNPPLAFSALLFLGGLILVFDYLKGATIKRLIFISLILGLVIGFKVYAGIIIFTSLFLAGTLEYIIHHKHSFLKIWLGTGIVNLVILGLTRNGSFEFPFFWHPWWFIQTMMVSEDHLNNVIWELQKQTYFLHNNWLRIIQLQAMAFLIFFFGNLGARFVGLWEISKSIRTIPKIESFSLLLLIITLVSFLVPLFFLQKGVVWNTIQFFYYFLFVMNIFAAMTISSLLSRFKLIGKIILGSLFVLLLIPTSLQTINNYWNLPPSFSLNSKQTEALNFLKSKNNKGIIVSPYNDLAYVPALTGHPVFFADQAIADTLNYKTTERKRDQEEFFRNPNELFLIENKITYVYLEDSFIQENQSKLIKLNLKVIFDNQKVQIWQVGGKI